MIQRIQTIYLLVVAILMVVMMSLPVGNVLGADNTIYEFTNLSITAQGGEPDYAPWALFAILMVEAVVSLITIFQFKRRILQMRLTSFATILMIGYYVVLVIFVLMLKGDRSFVPQWTVCLPFIAIVLNWLAVRAIGKDEAMVRSYERLR